MDIDFGFNVIIAICLQYNDAGILLFKYRYTHTFSLLLRNHFVANKDHFGKSA